MNKNQVRMHSVCMEHLTRVDVNVEFFQHVLNMHFNQLALNRAINFNMTVSTEVAKVWSHTTIQGMVINITVIPAELVDSCIGV